MNWTEERTVQLEALWGEGLSASQIARKIGGVTRNAVIGKVHRLGLSGRAKDARADLGKTTGPRPIRPAREGAACLVLHDAASEAVRRPAPGTQAESAGSALSPCQTEADERKTILELTERTCKWPVGDPSGEDFYFCGRSPSAGLPYCERHARVAYQPMCERRKERRSA